MSDQAPEPADSAPALPGDVGAAKDDPAKDRSTKDKSTDERSASDTDEDGEPAEDPRWAASRPGAASSGSRHRRAAQRVVNGDQVAGDLHVHLVGDQRAPLHRLAPDVIERASSRAHIFPAGWEETRRRFGRLRTAILAGDKGHGRTAAAVRLLLGARVETIYLLPGDADLSRLADLVDGYGHDGPPERAGFLLCEPDGVGELRAWVLNALEDSLGKAQARLVLITGTDTALADEDLVQWRIPLPPAPDRLEIMASHLRELLADDDAAEQVLRHDGVRPLAEKLLAQASCEAAYQLAYLLSREAPEPIDLARIRAEMAQREHDTFGMWFNRLPDLDVRCHAIALAVLDGNSYEDVSWAARELAEVLEPEQELVVDRTGDGIALRARRPDPFRWTRRRRLELLEAVGDGNTVSYRDGRRAMRVLERVWSEYPVHAELLDWLAKLVEHGSDEVAYFAGAALGKLTTYAFDRTAPALRAWADDHSYYKRLAVATALQVAAQEEPLRERIEGMVSGWYADREHPLAQATAARAYGMNRHLCDTTTALDAFERFMRIRMDNLSRRRARPLEVAIGQGLADLAADAGAAGLGEIYARLRRWFADPERSANAQLAFLCMAGGLQASSDPGAPAAVERWPLLLYLAGVDARLREPLIVLWRGAVHLRAHDDIVDSVLTDWAALAERDPALRDVLVRVLRLLAAADEPCRRFVGRLVELWTDDERLLPLTDTARAVDAVLGRQTEASR